MGVVFLYLLVHMSKNFIEDKPLINPKIFSSITREDDFYSVLIKFSEEVTFLYSTEEDKKNSRTLNQDNLKTMYSYALGNSNSKNKKNKKLNGYDNEYKHDINENYPVSVASLSAISYPIEPTLFMIVCNSIRNLINLVVDTIYYKKEDDDVLISELDNVLYQQVRSNIPFGSDSEDPDYNSEEDDTYSEVEYDVLKENDYIMDDDNYYEYYDSDDEDTIASSNDIYKELFDINYKHLNLNSLESNKILTRNQSDTLKYKNDIQMPIYKNDTPDDQEDTTNNNSSKNKYLKRNNSVLSNIFNNKTTSGFGNNKNNNKIYHISNDVGDPEEIKKKYLETKLCVACHKRPRSIVLWPCGCFCLCDTCRKVLALQKYDKCPCTNNEVQGYSKVFIP